MKFFTPTFSIEPKEIDIRVNLKPTKSLKPQIMKYVNINSKSKHVYPKRVFSLTM